MKNKLFTLVAVLGLAIGGVSLTGCGTEEEPTLPETPAQPTQPDTPELPAE